MTKQEALREINETQDFYVSKLIDIINGIDNRFENLKEIDFTSPTGTGKTVMVAKLINNLPNYFFVITSLSKGQLRYQIEAKIKQFCQCDNYLVYGNSEYTRNTRLQEKDIIKKLPVDREIIWIRDEGHIATNRWQEVLRQKSRHIINISATNKSCNGIQCNFTHTMMLRTPMQLGGLPEDALDKLKEIKKIHHDVKNYNPCALFRLFNDLNVEHVIEECKKRNFKYINITTEEYDMSDICLDNNEYDVIINKLKITEGIDLKRCHVIYMDNKPKNESTTVQIIGRARRNALFWRNDIDLLNEKNRHLLEETRKCYVFYNVPETEVAQNQTGELLYALCDTISVEQLKPNIQIHVFNGQLDNGLFVLELQNKTGLFEITYNENLKANVVNNNNFYKEKKITNNNFLLDFESMGFDFSIKSILFKESISDFFKVRSLFSKKDIDIVKFEFYLIKSWVRKNNEAFDIEWWEKYLRISDKTHLVNRDKYTEFKNCQLIRHIRFLFSGYNYKKYFSEEEIFDARQFASLEEPELVDYRNILVRDYTDDNFIKLDTHLLKHIEKIQYYDCSLAIKINSIISKLPTVIQLSSNRFRISCHPFLKYLKEKRKIDSLDKLSLFIKKSKGNRILLAKKDYWLSMIKNIHKFEDIDSYDVKVIDFYQLNDFYKLGLSKSTLDAYINNQYPLKTTTGEKYKNQGIFSMNYFLNFPQKINHRKFIIYRNQFENIYQPYIKTTNDYEIAVIGPDIMRYLNHRYIEDKPVTSKINKYCKFNKFITTKYAHILKRTSNKMFNGTNSFNFNKMCNSCLGFCVEYYAKMKLFGDDKYKAFIDQALMESGRDTIDDIIRIRASMLIYRHEMVLCYGQNIFSFVPGISLDNLLKKEYSSFVETVIELGNKTYNFVLHNLYHDKIDQRTKMYDPNLSVEHISALCDFLTNDTILELKCTSTISEKYIKQALSYYYLSTKRNDLNIKRIIVYDAVTDCYVEEYLDS